MNPDFPAAHSMDTTWFACDASGRVGIFFTGEDGPMPLIAYDDWNIATIVQLVSGRPATPEEEDGELDYAALEEEAASLGFYVYQYVDHSGDFVSPYSFSWMPGAPRHVDQLPPEMRRQFQRCRIERIEFPDSDNIQLADQIPGNELFFYYKDSVAYLCADEKTVRPILGKEAQFPDFCRGFRRRWPKLAENLIFDGPREPAQQENPEQPGEGNDHAHTPEE